MRFNEVIQTLRQDLRLPTLFPSADGACALEIDGVNLTLVSDEAGTAFTLYARIGHRAEGATRPAADELLAANHSHLAMRGLVIGMDGRRDLFLAQHVACAGLTPERVCALVGRFSGEAHQWQARLAAGAAVPA